MQFGDLRGWIKALQEHDEFREVIAEVDWNLELGTITRKVFGNGDGPALLFSNIKDYNRPDSLCRRLYTGSFSNYSRIALMFGLPVDAPITDMVKAARQAFSESIEPRIVNTGPVKENCVSSESIDLHDFPVPLWNRLDGGRYINTFCGNVSKDPDTGVHNIGVYRGMIGANNTIPLACGRLQHMGHHMAKYQARGEEMPVAFVFGAEPSLIFCAAAPIPAGVCEYDVMGAIRGSPLELVKCETVDLLVPASAEIVIEGYVSGDPATFEMEGPFGEYTGYYGGIRRPRHRCRVTSISYRDDPIFVGSLEGTLPKMLNENSIMSSIQRAALAWNVLERAGVPGVTDVHCSASNNGTTLVIQLHQTYRGQAKQAAAAIWGSSASVLRYKIVWVVDEDIDIHDYASLDWAFAYRVNAAEDDIVIFPATIGSQLDPSVRYRDRDKELFGGGKWARVLIDATMNLDYDPEPEYGGERFPPSVAPHPDDLALVMQRWKEYGL